MSTPVLLISLGSLTVFVWALGLFMGRARTSEECACPADGQSRTILFERRLNLAWDLGRPVDVLSCSAFATPTDVRCQKACMASRAQPGVETLPSKA